MRIYLGFGILPTSRASFKK